MSKKKKENELIKLTPRQEKYVQELITGKSQRQAMLAAYPQRIKWKENAIDNAASIMLAKPKVKARYEQLLAQVREKEKKNLVWERTESIKHLKYIAELNARDLQRIEEAHQDELERLEKAILENPDNAAELMKALMKARRQRRGNQINNKAVIDAIAELNKMQGYNEQTINMNNQVVFEGMIDLEE